jgi:UDP-glucuronate decarboxylase
MFILVISCCFQVRIARIFNTYGPRMCIDDGRVVSNFVAQVIRELLLLD